MSHRSPSRMSAVLAALCLTTAASAEIFDLKADFSLTNNPNGPWSYNLGDAPLTALVANWGGVPTLTAWTTTPASVVPPAWGIASSDVIGAHDWVAGDVVGHSTNGIGSAPATVAWTAAADGFISISGRTWDAAFAAGRNAEWTLELNGVTLASRAGIAGLFRSDAAALFANNIVTGQSLDNLQVNAGDVVRFRLHTTTALGHFAGVDLTITHQVPAPATVLIASMPLLAAARRRR